MVLVAAAGSSPQSPRTHRLEATPETVAYGYYWSEAKPVLRIGSGDIIDVDTLLTNSPTGLARAGVPDDKIQDSLKAVVAAFPQGSPGRGPGGHILTGPVYVEGAEPGDALEVKVLSIDLAIDYGYNGCSGFIRANCDQPTPPAKIFHLDRGTMTSEFLPGIVIPLKPFFGSMGVAPAPEIGRVSSNPPGRHAGNLDNKELVAGSTLFIPVHARGALLLIGDGHAAQGNGEVTITALETSLIGTFQVILRKDMKLRWPRAETETHYISMGIHEDLNEATKMALREMIDFLVTEKHLTRDDAYMLSSAAADLNITQLVDGNKGVHAMISKAIFVGQKIGDDSITLERTACFGTCPMYKVTVTSDGTVTFNGERFTKTTGVANGKISRESFRQLVSEFEKINYFSLPDRYTPGTPVCPQRITDMPSANTSIRLKGKAKGVMHYYGCGDKGALAQLTALEKKIDEVLGTQKWIK